MLALSLLVLLLNLDWLNQPVSVQTIQLIIKPTEMFIIIIILDVMFIIIVDVDFIIIIDVELIIMHSGC